MMFKALIQRFTKSATERRVAKHLKQARAMMQVAKQDKANGFHCAAQAAVQSALSYRAAAHATRFYG